MKFSTAMRKGFEKVGGRRNLKGGYFDGGTPTHPRSVCALGAVSLGLTGSAHAPFNSFELPECKKFERVWGACPADLHDKEQLPWEHIYGMAVAAGL